LQHHAAVRRTLALALVLVPALAHAAVTTDTDIHFRLFKVEANGTRDTLDAAQISRQFSEAVCLCQEKFDLEVYLSSTVAAQVGPLTGGRAELWAGVNCNDTGATSTQPRDERCVQISTLQLSVFTQTQTFHLTADQFSVATLQTANGTMPVACAQQQVSPGLWLLIDENSDGTYESKASLTIPFDGQPPTPPDSVTAEAGNEAVVVKWDLLNGQNADVDGFQIICARGDLQVFKTGSFAAGFKSTGSECPGKTPLPIPDGGVVTQPTDGGAFPVLAPVDDGGTSGGMSGDTSIPPFGPFLTLDPAFICSDRLAKTVREQRIQGLQNGIPYEFAVVAIDKVGNPSQVLEARLTYPQGNEDLWQHYHDLGGSATGGFCEALPGAPALATLSLGIAAIAAALMLRRRR
jgi:hypothetical protein